MIHDFQKSGMFNGHERSAVWDEFLLQIFCELKILISFEDIPEHTNWYVTSLTKHHLVFFQDEMK